MVHQTLPLLCFVLLEVSVIQVLIGYLNTTSNQVFVYDDGHIIMRLCFLVSAQQSHSVTHAMCHFGNRT